LRPFARRWSRTRAIWIVAVSPSRTVAAIAIIGIEVRARNISLLQICRVKPVHLDDPRRGSPELDFAEHDGRRGADPLGGQRHHQEMGVSDKVRLNQDPRDDGLLAAQVRENARVENEVLDLVRARFDEQVLDGAQVLVPAPFDFHADQVTGLEKPVGVRVGLCGGSGPDDPFGGLPLLGIPDARQAKSQGRGPQQCSSQSVHGRFLLMCLPALPHRNSAVHRSTIGVNGSAHYPEQFPVRDKCRGKATHRAIPDIFHRRFESRWTEETPGPTI
jgi:hypothetical protein